MIPSAEIVLWLFNGLLAGMLFTLSVGYGVGRSDRWPPFLLCLATGALVLAFGVRLTQRWVDLTPDLAVRWPEAAAWAPLWRALDRFLPGMAMALVWSATRAVRQAGWRGPLLLVVAAWVGVGVHLQRPVDPWAAAVGGAAAVGWLLEVRHRPRFFRPFWHGAAVLGFLLAQVLRWPGPALGFFVGPLAEPLAFLGFLAAFSFAYEVFRGPSWMAEFFVRLNWLFILLAAGTMLIVEREFRSNYMELTHRQLQDFVETLRGIMVNAVIRGEVPEAVLRDPAVLEEVVKAFSRYPDLRSVALQVRQARVGIDIDPDGAVRVRPMPVETWEDIPLEGRMEVRFGEVRLDVPVLYRGAPVGGIRMQFQVFTMFRQILESLWPIFGVFTTAVVVAGFLIGVILFRAHKTIERQFREIHRANLELLQAAKWTTLGELVASIAHDVATPLGSLLLGLDAVDDRLSALPEGQDLRQDVALLRDQVLRVSAFIQHLLHMAKARPVERQETSVADSVRRALELVHSRIRRHRIQVVENGLHALPPVWGNEVQLEEVFLNIINNAVEAMPDGGVLEIEGRWEGAWVWVRFTDTGPGMEPDVLARALDPFFTTKPTGTGLGLTISRRIVEAHGGSLRVFSEPGRGTTVEVGLPVPPPSPSRASGG